MSIPSSVITAMKQEEMRKLNSVQTMQQIPAQHSYKYSKYLAQQFPTPSAENLQIQNTLVDELGMLYNDDSHGQLTHSIPRNAIQVQHETITRWVVLNSEDRDWYNRQDENPYTFAVHLGYSSQYLDQTGKYRNIELTVNKSFENINRVECSSIILPNRTLSNGFKPSNRPHFLISLGKPSEIVYGSNRVVDNATSVLIPKIPVPSENFSFRYIEYSSTSGMAKEYLTPDASINRLLINISRPDGYSPWLDGPSIDVIPVKTIYSPNIAGTFPTLDVITDGFFNQSDFLTGDIIKFRGYVFRDTDFGLNSVKCAQFNQFINREAGHIVQSIGSYSNTTVVPYSGSMYNVITIPSPASNSTITGYISYPDFFDDGFRAGTTIEDAPTPSSVFDNTKGVGKLINTNSQTTVVLKIGYLDKNAGQLLKKPK